MHRITATIPNEFPIDLFPIGKGINVTGRKVVFNGYSQDTVDKLLESTLWKYDQKSGTSLTIKLIKDSDRRALAPERVAELQPHTSLILADFKVYRMITATTKIDRDRDKFTKAWLEKVASLTKDHAPAFLYMHDTREVIGKVFYSEVTPMTDSPGEFQLVEYFAVNPSYVQPGQPNVKIYEAIENGTLEYVSIGFFAHGEIKEQGTGSYVRIYDWDGSNSFEPIHPETSLVSFGAQPGARIKKLNGEDMEDASKYFSLKTKTILMPTFPITVNGKTLNISADLEGENNISVKGISEAQAEIKAVEEKAAKYDVLHKQLSDLMEPVINNVENLQGEKGLNKSMKYTREKLMSMTPAEVTAIEKDLQTDYEKAFPGGQFAKLPLAKGAGETEEKKEKSIYSKY